MNTIRERAGRLQARTPVRLSFPQLRTATWILVALFLSLPVPIRARATGAIEGTVTDPSGAVIPGAKITAIRVETGLS